MPAAPIPESPVATLVTASALRLAYGRHVVITDVDLSIRPGEFWLFVGPNGSGKTTFVRAVLGLLRPASGSLCLAPEVASRRGVGYVAQETALGRTLPMRVLDVVRLGAVGAGLDRREVGDRIEEVLGELGLTPLAGSSYWALSSGQRRRVLLARALVRSPALLVLDEPTTGLDPQAEARLVAQLEGLQRSRGVTVLLVTHRLELAGRLAARVALFHGGRVVPTDTGALREDARFRDAFGEAGRARVADGVRRDEDLRGTGR